MDRNTRIMIYLAIALLATLAVMALLPSATALPIQVFEGNENAASAIWLETPVTLDSVWIWRGSNGTTNQDYWKFNASAGQYIQVKFRKYTNTQNPPPPYRGGTYYMKYEVWDTAYRPIHEYHRTYRENGGYPYRRDSWSFMVPENLGGRFFIRVWVDPPQGEDRDFAYYFLNVTVKDVQSLNDASSYAGVMAMSDEYNVDYNFADYYTVSLTKGQLMAVNLNKDEPNHAFYMEVWESIPFGAASQQDHMLNRTQAVAAPTIQVRFVATHDGVFTVFVWRYTNVETGTTVSSGYSITWTYGTATLEADDSHDGGTVVEQSVEIRRQSLEMGYDVHDWYQVKILDGDKLLRVTVTFNDPAIDDGHAYELVIYNETGFMMWADTSRDPGPEFATELEQPPVGTTTIFDQDETFYVRISVNTVDCDWGFAGFRANYAVEFKMSNRPPSLITPFEDVYEWDEDETLSIELDSHFTDPEGDKMTYTIYNKTIPDFDYDVTSLSFLGYLNITPPPDWNGEVWWRLRAVDSGQTAEHHYIYIDLHLIVRPVPDMPRSNGTITVQCAEETSATWDLKKTFYDADTGYQGLLTFGWINEGEEDIEVTLDPLTGEVLLVPAMDVTGIYEFTVFCYDNSMEQITETLTLTVTPENDVPRIVGPIPVVEMDEGDDPVEIDLSQYFKDVDGDDLVYSWTVPNEFSDGINVYHKNNVATESTIVIELLDDHFYDHVVINITCEDPDETQVRQDLVIDIANVPNAPVISVTPAGAAPDIDEAQTTTFAVTDLQDADELEFGQHNFTWYLDEVMVLQETGSLSSYAYHPDYEASGPHTVRLVVRDPTGLGPATDPTWTFQVRNVNRQPTVTITTLATTLDEDQKITLTVDASDPDGDELDITWYLITKDEDKPLGVGSPLEVKLPAGTNKIDVQVTDGKGGMATASFTQKVNTVEEEGGMGMWIGLIVLIVIVAVIALMLLKMRGGKAAAQPAATIDIESLQQGYDPTQGREGEAGSEYEEYNPAPSSSEGYEPLR